MSAPVAKGMYAPAAVNAATHTSIRPSGHQNKFGATFGRDVQNLQNRISFFASYDNDHSKEGSRQ